MIEVSNIGCVIKKSFSVSWLQIATQVHDVPVFHFTEMLFYSQTLSQGTSFYSLSRAR